MITINDIEQKQNELNKMIAEFKEQEEDRVKESSKIWTPKYGEAYYFLNSGGEVVCLIYYGTSADDGHIVIGNYYRTEAEAKHAREKKTLEQDLRSFCHEPTYCELTPVYCLKRENCSLVIESGYDIYQGTIYTTVEQDLIEFIKNHGEEKILRFLF